MDGDRKYRQHGYADSDRVSGSYNKERQPRPKLPLDITGPRLPRLVQNVVASRCFSCATALPAGIDFKGACPKCGAALHCCKQCVNFEPSTRFQCVRPILERIPVKDGANECTFFSPRVTVARDGLPAGPVASRSVVAGLGSAAPRTPSDARAAFDNLFKK
jgi:hypothetical protein